MAVEGISPVSWSKPQIGQLPGGRLHLQQGPIDLIIKATGSTSDIKEAYEAATRRFATVLGELTSELVQLRQPLLGSEMPLFASAIAQRMAVASWPHRAVFITPMAAVAGSVADAVLAEMVVAAPTLHTVYINNGGDIALHIAAGNSLKIGVVADLIRAIPEGFITVTSESGIGGIATSGWRGRSFSLGIADAVTVLASTAALADASATMIANAVNANDPAIIRAPARSLDPDSDLGDRMVTTGVGRLSDHTCQKALDHGVARAQGLIRDGTEAGSRHALITAVYISLQGQNRTVSVTSEKSLS